MGLNLNNNREQTKKHGERAMTFLIPMLRLYWPKDTPPSIIDGTWQSPPVKQVP